MPLPVYHSLCRELPKVELIKADDTLISLRINKSANEIKLAKRAYEISEIAVGAILNEIKPGMTELQVIGIAQREIYQHGGEYEGHSLYCFCGPATKHAISKSSNSTSARALGVILRASACRSRLENCRRVRSGWWSLASKPTSRRWS
jgi:Xaa-Pro aminopeptidase